MLVQVCTYRLSFGLLEPCRISQCGTLFQDKVIRNTVKHRIICHFLHLNDLYSRQTLLPYDRMITYNVFCTCIYKC